MTPQPAAAAAMSTSLPSISWTVEKTRTTRAELVTIAQSDQSTEPNGVRLAPLLLIASDALGCRTIIVGNLQIVVNALNYQVALKARISALWRERVGAPQFTAVELGTEEARPLIETVLVQVQQLATTGGPAPEGSHHQAAQIAKNVAEASRNAVADLREIRYQVETLLVASSSSKSSPVDHTSVVETLLQLNIVCSRASDQARECIREGLWVHITDEEAYHAYRRLQEPTIINPTPTATAETRTWMRLHDAGMRQCLELRRQLEAESSSIRDLLTSAASISNSREADSQSRFNLLLAVISFSLGVPALVLGLYGADLIMPLTTGQRTWAFVPILSGLVIAAVLTYFKAPKGEHQNTWRIGAAGIVAVILLLIVAGLISGSLGPRI